MVCDKNVAMSGIFAGGCEVVVGGKKVSVSYPSARKHAKSRNFHFQKHTEANKSKQKCVGDLLVWCARLPGGLDSES
jgi:hypothetical protein